MSADRPRLVVDHDPLTGLMVVTGVNGMQSLMSEEQIARHDPEELAVLIEAGRILHADDLGCAWEPTPVERAAAALQRRVWVDEARRRAAAAKARNAARAPRVRSQHPSRARAMEIAAEISARRPDLRTARLGVLVADALVTEGLPTPATRTICGWITISGS